MAEVKAEAKVDAKKKGTNPLLVVGIGCFVLLIVAGVVGSIAVKFFAKQIGLGALQSAIESKTGIKTNLSGLEEGKMTLTDKETGTTVEVGSDKLPDNFPKDFPVYPGAKVTGVLSGSEKGVSTGVWVTFETNDSKDNVSAFYKENLKANGWEETAMYATSDTVTQSVRKGNVNGTVGITQAEDGEQTEIVVMLAAEE
jgi:hypothetical protein